jgi:8-oxo-dGTP pyrophosphatase MutT (NUDIX family)
MAWMRGPIELPQVRRALGGAAPRAELERARRAAVAVVLAPSGAPGDALSLLLMRRSEREGDPWSGHMALPGGHAHRADADLLHTARRETLEEVGIDLSDAELLGALDDVSPMRSSEIAVRPFVFALATLREVSLSDEVAPKPFGYRSIAWRAARSRRRPTLPSAAPRCACPRT